MRISDWSSDVCSSDLDLAVEQALRFQGLDEVLLGAQARHAHPLHQAQRLVLAVVVGEHQAGDFVGHGLEQLVALFDLELARLHLAVEQDLDVDLVVRGVHAGRVVDEVGVAQHTVVRGLDAAALGEAKVAALATPLTRSSPPLMRMALLARSPTSALDSPLPLTKVPVTPCPRTRTSTRRNSS